MRIILIFLFCTLGLVYTSSAQKNKGKSKKEVQGRSNAFEPYVSEEAMAPPSKKERRKHKKFSFRALFNKRLDDAREEFWDRIEANAKRDRKIRRKMGKPQYSDPMYFGHKRKPKKREPGKRKFCKECGIVH